MKATEAKLLDFLKKSPQFVIPIYQRTYSWTERECRQLWDDVLRTRSNDRIAGHLIGSIVYIEKGLYQVSSQSPLPVIDGQQRLTTVMLMLEALAQHLGDAESVDGFSAKKVRSYYLLNPLEDGERGFKLLLTQTDKDSLLALLQQKPQPAQASLRITENIEFFMKQVRALADLAPLCKGLAKLMIVEVLAPDPCVGEEVLKHYIAYKAEINFVDAVPQKNRLRLSLNLPFHELHDPSGLAKDVTNLGRWGNGDVEVGLSEPSEMAYAMGLVRQAFEKQMGNGEGEA